MTVPGSAGPGKQMGDGRGRRGAPPGHRVRCFLETSDRGAAPMEGGRSGRPRRSKKKKPGSFLFGSHGLRAGPPQGRQFTLPTVGRLA